jgi:hypothetical protein
MSWPASIGVAILCAIVGLFVVGVVASLWATWYSWSQFEGGAGYAAIGCALLGAVLSFVIGLITARYVGAGATPSFLRALGLSLAIVLGTTGSIALAGRALADVAPRVGGQALDVLVELRWPASQRERPTADAISSLTLGAPDGGGGFRTSAWGPLLVEDARLTEERRWVAAGFAPLVTERGERLLEVVLDGAHDRASAHRFSLPLPARPDRSHFQWSDWLATENAANGLTLRYRLQPRNVPQRAQTFGPFEVRTTFEEFFTATSDSGRRSAHSTFALLHRGRPVALDAAASDSSSVRAQVNGLGVVTGPRPALVARMFFEDLLVVDDGARARVERLGPHHGSAFLARPITNDVARFRASTRPPLSGWVDRESMAEPGLYLVGEAVLDTRTLQVHRLPEDPSFTSHHLPVLGASPDERSIVRLVRRTPEQTAEGESRRYDDEAFALGVTELATGRSVVVPIDRLRMRFPEIEVLDPAWIAHHFTWVRDADGSDRLRERTDFVPLPHRGKLQEDPGRSAFYSIAPAGVPLRDALLELLVAEAGAERLPDPPHGNDRQLRVEGLVVDLSVVDHYSPFVSISVSGVVPDERRVVPRLAQRVDAAVATGRFDALFGWR